MRLKIFYVIAESQMVQPLRTAASRLNARPDLPVQFDVEGIVAGDGGVATAPSGATWIDPLRECDIFIGSMLNSDRDVRFLDHQLQQRRPPVTAIFTSQQELLAHVRLGPLDGNRLFHDRTYCRSLAHHIRERGVPLPPLPRVLLAASPRLEPRLGQAGLSDLWAYARAALYWLQGSPDNLEGLLLHLAAHHPAVAARLDPEPTPWVDRIPPPRVYPEMALWHPAAPDFFSDLNSYLEWYEPWWRAQWGGTGGIPTGFTAPPRIGVVMFRQYITSGSSDHYARAIQALEAQGLQVIPGFGGLDSPTLVQRFMAPAHIDLLLNLTGFNLAGSMGNPQPQAAADLLQRLDIPYLVGLPLLFQTEEGWRRDPLGLPPMQTALQVVLPELEGGIEPRVYAGRDGEGRFDAFDAEVERLARRVRRWVHLRRLPAHQRKIALVIFSFPPDKGSVGSAAYLDVFASVYRLLNAMKREGYAVDVPPDVDALRQAVLGGQASENAELSPVEGAVADRLDAAAYRQLVPYGQRLIRQWGPPPGSVDLYGGRLAIKGASFGQVFVGIQPSFGYEGDPMRLLLSPDASPSHSFAAFYGWLEKAWGADAILHVGTHGALEFMPGKQVGLTGQCYPDALIGDIPHLYLYAVNNPSEATIAKRRGYATCITYLTPPLGAAGLYKDLADLKDAIEAYRRATSATTRRAALATLGDLVRRAGLEDDLAARGIALPVLFAPSNGEANLRVDRERSVVDRLADYLHELETELIPLGLHVTGEPLDDEQRQRFLDAVLSHPRPEDHLPSLDALLAQWPEAQRWARQHGGAALRERALAYLTDDEGAELFPEFPSHTSEGRLADGQSSPADVPQWVTPHGRGNAADGKGMEPEDGTTPIREPAATWQRLVAFSRDFLARLDTDEEIQAVLRGLAGRYIPPSPGGEPARRPEVLPTGRNLHALDPQKVPSPTARRAGAEMAEGLLQRYRKENGRYPRTVAMVLWGTDNIKTEGEGLAQALHLMGVEVVEDSLGRANRLRLIPLEELGRPRIDVVMTVSGIFRDIFPGAMELLDEGVRLAAGADEPPELNFLRHRTAALSERLQLPWEVAASRVFSNKPGQYGAGVNVAVESSEWETTEELGRLFIERKGFAFGLHLRGEDQRDLLAACLAEADVTFQNIDSTEISLADVDHYFEYLGGVTAAAQAASGTDKPRPVYVADRLRGHGRLRSLQEALQVEVRTRLLNPTWYEKMLEHGYQGVHEVATRLDNTLGWSATAQGSVGAWAYAQVADTFLLDDEMRRRLASLNPRATYRMASGLVEAARRGWWQPDDGQRQKLREAFLELENQVELETTA